MAQSWLLASQHKTDRGVGGVWLGAELATTPRPFTSVTSTHTGVFQSPSQWPLGFSHTKTVFFCFSAENQVVDGEWRPWSSVFAVHKTRKTQKTTPMPTQVRFKSNNLLSQSKVVLLYCSSGCSSDVRSRGPAS